MKIAVRCLANNKPVFPPMENLLILQFSKPGYGSFIQFVATMHHTAPLDRDIIIMDLMNKM